MPGKPKKQLVKHAAAREKTLGKILDDLNYRIRKRVVSANLNKWVADTFSYIDAGTSSKREKLAVKEGIALILARHFAGASYTDLSYYVGAPGHVGYSLGFARKFLRQHPELLEKMGKFPGFSAHALEISRRLKK